MPPADFHPYVGCVAMSDDGRRAIRLTDAGLELWDLGAGRRARVVAGAWRGWMSGDGRVIVTATRNGTTLQVASWDGAALCTIPGSRGSAVAVGGARIVTRRAAEVTVTSNLGIALAYRCIVEGRDLRGHVLWSRQGALGVITSEQAQMSRDGTRALLAFEGDRVALFDCSTGKIVWSGRNTAALAEQPLPWGRSGLALEDRGHLLVAGGPRSSISLPAGAIVAWVSPDAARVAVRLKSGAVEIRSARDGSLLARTVVRERFCACRVDGDALVIVTPTMQTRRLALGMRRVCRDRRVSLHELGSSSCLSAGP